MAVPLSEIANVSVTSETAAVTQAGFGIPLILSANAAFAERVRTYTSLSGLSADFASTTVEYQCAREIFAQSPRPEYVYVGRLANKPTQVYTITPTAVNSAVYKLKVRAQAATAATEISITADSDTTATEIVTALKAAYDALAISSFTSGGTSTMTLTGASAGNWLSVESTTSPIDRLKVAQTHTTSSISDDLDAILLENAEWYCIISLYNSTADVAAIASWTQSNSRFYIAQTSETIVATTASGSDTTSIADSLRDSARTRTALVYHECSGAFLDAAMAGKCLPKTPGSETWAHKQLTLTEGVSTLTSTMVTNMKAKNCGYFTTLGGINITFEGKVSSGDYIDVVRMNDWIVSRIQEALVALMASSDKVPYTDAGVYTIVAEIKAVLEEGISNGGIAPDSVVVTAPRVADVSDADKTSRTLNDVLFNYTNSGAIQKVNVEGRASV